MRLALAGELVPDAVNVQGGVIAEEVRPGIPLTERLGRVFTALAGEVAQQIDVEVRGEIAEFDVKVLELAALKGVFADVVEDQVSYVNAPLLAAERGTAVRLVTDPESPDHRNLITIRGTLADGSQVSVSGTLIGIWRRGSGWSRSTASTSTSSRPTTWRSSPTRTVPAWSASSAGSSARPRSTSPACRSSRDAKGGSALVALSVDSAIPADDPRRDREAIEADSVRGVNLR